MNILIVAVHLAMKQLLDLQTNDDFFVQIPEDLTNITECKQRKFSLTSVNFIKANVIHILRHFISHITDDRFVLSRISVIRTNETGSWS